MKKTKLYRALAVFLAVVMCFTMTSAFTFADTNTDRGAAGKTVLVFGDSTSSGFGLPDFSFDNDAFDVNNNDLRTWSIENATSANRGRISNDSHPWQLKQYIADQEFGGDLDQVDLSSMCFGGTRTDELRALLDNDFYEEMRQQEEMLTKSPTGHVGFLTEHIDRYMKALRDGGAAIDGHPVATVADAQAYTRAEIANADVIVVDVCTNNFGTYAAGRICGALGVKGFEDEVNYQNQTVNDIKDLPVEVRSALNAMGTLIKKEYLPGNEFADVLIDTYMYCYACCIVNYSADMQMIMELKKPDAKVIAVGMYNSLDGTSLDINGQTFPLGEVGDLLFGSVNAYLRAVDKNSTNYYFADLSGGLESFVEQLSQAKTLEDLTAENAGDHLIASLCESMTEEFMGADTVLTEEQTIRAKQLLLDVSKINAGDFSSLRENISNSEAIAAEISTYILNGQPEISDEAKQLLNIYERFLFSNGIGLHPSKKGCGQKADAVKKAYDSNVTAFGEVKNDLLSQLNRLTPIARKLIEICTAVSGLPEYEKANLEAIEANNGKIEELQGRTEVLEQQIVQLKAKYIKVDLQVSATFPANTAKVTASWAADSDADGYLLKVNGQRVSPKQSGGVLNYEINQAQVGKSYRFDVMPFINAGGTRVCGKMFTKTIVPKVTVPGMKLDKLKKGKKSFTAKWTAVSGADGYQLSYKTGKKAKDLMVPGGKTVSKKVKNLKKKKTYTVKIRAYKTVNGKNYYGPWSASKKVTTK